MYGYKVLLIDGDLRKPSLHKIFGLREQNSINRYLNSNCTWQSQIVKISKYQLSLLCARKNLKESETLLSNEKLCEGTGSVCVFDGCYRICADDSRRGDIDEADEHRAVIGADMGQAPLDD